MEKLVLTDAALISNMTELAHCEVIRAGLSRNELPLRTKHIRVEHSASGDVKLTSGSLPFSGPVGSRVCSMKHFIHLLPTPEFQDHLIIEVHHDESVAARWGVSTQVWGHLLPSLMGPPAMPLQPEHRDGGFPGFQIFDPAAFGPQVGPRVANPVAHHIRRQGHDPVPVPDDQIAR
jgi:hypothetical protein